MAKPVKAHDFRRPGRPRLYQWDQWLDGRTWRLTAGEDYSVSTTKMQMTAYQQARRMGLRVRTEVAAGGLYIQAYRSD
jgi:hypothetical protein